MTENRVMITVEAKDAASGVLRGISGQFGEMGGLIDQLTSKDVAWGNVAETATNMVINGLRDVITETQKYDEEVEGLSILTNTSTESASRFLNVMGRFGVDMPQIEAVMRKMAMNGISPSIETLGQLSDKFNKLGTAAEKDKFLMDNFGRSGMSMAEVMTKGSATLDKLNGRINQALILTPEQTEANEKLSQSFQELAQNTQATVVSFGNALVPSLNDVVTQMNRTTEATQLAHDQGRDFNYMTIDEKNTLFELVDAGRGVGAMYEDNEKAARMVAITNKDVISTTKDVANSHKELIGSVQAATKEDQSFNEKNLAIYQANAKLNESVAKLTVTNKEYEEYQSKIAHINDQAARGKINHAQATNQLAKAQDELNAQATHGTISQAEYDKAMATNTKELQANAAAHLQWAKDTIFAMVQARAAAQIALHPEQAGSITDFVIKSGVKLGEFDASTATAMEDVNKTMDTLDTTNAEAAIQKLIDAVQKLQNLASQPLNITVTTGQSLADASSSNTNNQPPAAGKNVKNGKKTEAKALGGPVTAGQPYMVGEDGPELLVPETNGTIIPNRKDTPSASPSVTIHTLNINWSGANAGSVQRLMADIGAASG